MRFDLTGYNTDNLIKTLHQKKVKLYSIVKRENSLSFTIDDKDEKKVKRYILNFKYDKTPSFFKQIPKILNNNLCLILVLIFSAFVYSFLVQFTWQIEIYGNENLTKSEILEVLNNNGVRTKHIVKLSSEEIESIMLNNYDRIAQVSVIKDGTAIIINLSEKLVYNETEFNPIRANFSGKIEEIKFITGTLNCKVGDYVNEGDILVYPYNIDTAGNKISVKPLAEIKGEIFVIGKAEKKKTEDVLVRTGKTITTYDYQIFNFKYSGKRKNSFALFDEMIYNENVGSLLPLKRKKKVYYELNSEKKDNDFNLIKDELLLSSLSDAQSHLPYGDIREENSYTYINNDTMYAITTITIFGIIND